MTDTQLRPGAPLFQQAVCGLPNCGMALYMEWTASRPIYLTDTAADLAVGVEAYMCGWAVTCEGGHTILLPIDDGAETAVFGQCRCEPGESTDWCGHTDMERLRTAIGAGALALVP